MSIKEYWIFGSLGRFLGQESVCKRWSSPQSRGCAASKLQAGERSPGKLDKDWGEGHNIRTASCGDGDFNTDGGIDGGMNKNRGALQYGSINKNGDITRN